MQDLVLLQWVICINFHRYEENLSLNNIKIMFTICAILGYFKMIELTENMRQKDHQPFTELLSRFRTASQTDNDIKCIQSRVVHPTDIGYPAHTLHIFAENAPVDQHNNAHLQHLTTPLYNLKATDQYPAHVSKQDIDKVLARGRSETGGLEPVVSVKEKCSVMLTTNIDINDRLINGQMGTIKKIAINQSTSKPSVLNIKFDDPTAGSKTIYLFSFAYNYTNKQTRISKHFCPTPKRTNFNATYMIVKLNLGRFNFTIIHIHLICLKLYEPKLGNCLKTRHRPRQILSKRSKYAEPLTFQGWTKR